MPGLCARHPRGVIYEHLILFAAFGVVWAIVAPRVSGSPWGLVAGQAASLALTAWVCWSLFPEGARRPRVVAVAVYLALAAVSTAYALQVPWIPVALRDPEMARMTGLVAPVLQPLLAFEAGKRAIGEG